LNSTRHINDKSNLELRDKLYKPAFEKAVLVGLIMPKQPEKQLAEYMDELEFLVMTAGGQTMKRFTQKVEHPNAATFVNKGKAEEIQDYVKAEEIDLIVFDDELTPTQVKNLERMFEGDNVKVLDRTTLILDIFASRAQTSHAKTQVELAQLQYLLPRLTRMWTHLERQKGGIGMRGPGESQIESDRRAIKNTISLLREKLATIDRVMATQRKSRGNMVRVALVGYTNVGKSTIMSLLTKSEIYADNKLFATLDTTVRKMTIENLPFLISDTVGFIRKLPTRLVESFKSTLDEVREADVLLHVVDVSHPNYEEQIAVVKKTLEEIKALDKPTILVFNKIDAYENPDKPDYELEGEFQKSSLAELKKSYMAMENVPCVFISAMEKENVEELKAMLYNMAVKIHEEKYPGHLLY
jgi:GTP-binding protein HflX